MRKVWVTKLDIDIPADTEVLIEQFDDNPPTIAFRLQPWHSWGPPIKTINPDEYPGSHD
jgi:hypothetical protein